MSTLADLVQEWIRLDKVSLKFFLLASLLLPSYQNPETRKEIQTLWAAGQVEELEKRMRSAFMFFLSTSRNYFRTLR